MAGLESRFLSREFGYDAYHHRSSRCVPEPLARESPTGDIGAWETALYPPPWPVPVPAVNRFLVKIAYQMTMRKGLSPLREYNAFQLILDSSHTLADVEHGVAACGGCETGVTLLLDWMGLFSDTSQFWLESPKANNCITWQSSTAGCWHAVPVRNTTWGAIKGFYR